MNLRALATRSAIVAAAAALPLIAVTTPASASATTTSPSIARPPAICPISPTQLLLWPGLWPHCPLRPLAHPDTVIWQ